MHLVPFTVNNHSKKKGDRRRKCKHAYVENERILLSITWKATRQINCAHQSPANWAHWSSFIISSCPQTTALPHWTLWTRDVLLAKRYSAKQIVDPLGFNKHKSGWAALPGPAAEIRLLFLCHHSRGNNLFTGLYLSVIDGSRMRRTPRGLMPTDSDHLGR